MTRSQQEAMAIRRRWGLPFPVATDGLMRLVGRLGLKLHDSPDPEVEEALIGRHILLAAWLPEAERRWLLAHALGHYLLHCGDQLELLARDRWLVRKQEAQAEAFAGWLLLGDLGWAWPSMEVWQAAEVAEVPPERLARWWELVRDEVPTPAVMV